MLPAATAEKLDPHRSPVDVAVLPDGRHALTANHTADSVSLIDLTEGKVLAEQAVGRKPWGIACSRDGTRAAVSNLWSGALTLLEINQSTVKTLGNVKVGPLPRGLVFAADGKSVYLALGGADEVVQLDWDSRKIMRRWPAPREPRGLALSRDGHTLAAASGRSAQVRLWDVNSGKQVSEKTVIDGFNLFNVGFTPDDRELVAPHAIRRDLPVAQHNIDQGWVIDNRLTRISRGEKPRFEYWQIALDTRGQAVGDAYGVAFSRTGGWLAVTAPGTHEVLLFDSAGIPWNSGDPGDFLDFRLDRSDGKYRRLNLGGRPMAVTFLGDTEQAVIANYLLDAVQVVDVKAGKVVRSVALGGPAKPSLARQGEAIFYDAKRAHHDWFSCHTCHSDGHTNSLRFDTLNDESYGNPKLTPTLRNVTKTGPWTWHGWQDDLGKSVEKSMTETLFGKPPSSDDVKAVLAFLETLDDPPSPYVMSTGSLTESAQRGKELFRGKARCARCHQGEYYTSAKNYDVGLESDGSPFDHWNPPSLRGLWDRGPYLHDGRSSTLEELLRADHSPEKLGGQALTPEERRDLIEFLKSL
jgi:YVTN family beta-propeller protein